MLGRLRADLVRAARRASPVAAAPADHLRPVHGARGKARGRHARAATAGSTAKAGIARIPIDRAMEIVAETGLPEGQGPADRGRAQQPPRDARSTDAGQGRPKPRSRCVPDDCEAPMSRRPRLAGRAGRPRRAAGRPAPSRTRRPACSAGSASTRTSTPSSRSTCRFRDEAGRTVALGDYFGKKPVILTLVYYRLPDALQRGAERACCAASSALSFDVGKDFDVVTVSIDPKETPEPGRARRRRSYLERYGRQGAEAGWHFLTGDEAVDRRAGQGRRIPLRLRRQDRPVRPRRRHRDR